MLENSKLKRIEEELAGYVRTDKKNWVRIYQLMKQVDTEKLYKERDDTPSFTAWVNALADNLHVHVSLLWARLKAGRTYTEYEARAAEQGRTVVPLAGIAVSPDSLNLCEKVAGKNAVEMDRLIAKRRKQLEKKTELDKQIENVKQKYGVDPHREASTVPTLTSNIRASRGNLEKQRKLLESCKSAISDYTRQQQDAERELNSMGANNTGTVTQVAETEWKHISTFLEAVCKDVQEKARKELLKKIEERANEFYEKFTEHDKGYKGRVEIDEDYTITFDGGLNTSHEDRKKMSIINALLSLNQDALQTYYPFISDAPTSSFDPSTTHKYLLGIKDIFGQSIIMTKDVEVGSDKYRDLYNQNNVSRILQLDSQIYRDDAKEPEIWEVSTIVKSLK